jgi:hypothetical protein
MIKDNLKERINAEKEIRESVREQFRQTSTAPSPSQINLNALPRSNLRLNLTGEDNLERLSMTSRGPGHGHGQSFSEYFRGSNSNVVNPMAQPPQRVLSNSTFSNWDHTGSNQESKDLSPSPSRPASTSSSPPKSPDP